VGSQVDVVLVSIEYFLCLTGGRALNEDGNLLYEKLSWKYYHQREWKKKHGEYQAISLMDFIE
jgi:hypothetical protein